jgi:succinyl-CoA synthetase beta subunit
MMILHEYQAKELFRRYGIVVPSGTVAEDAETLVALGGDPSKRVVVKAQVHSGGRGKAGAIKVAESLDDARNKAREILSMKVSGLAVRKVLIEEALDIEKEFYLGITLDRDAARDLVMLSTQGGMDIEEVARLNPSAISRLPIEPHLGLQEFQIRECAFSLGLPKEECAEFGSILRNLYKLYIELDATLVEINPLVLTHRHLIAADAKIMLDDNALFRHPQMAPLSEIAEEDPIEREAHKKGLAYVRLGGDIGIIGNGAGLVMATLDMISREGGHPANFLDIGGGAKAPVVKKALEVVLSDPHVKGIFFNIFGGITRCDEVAMGIVEALEEMQMKVPLVIKLCGTKDEEGRAILKKSNLIPVAEIREGARKIVELVHSAAHASTL